ncbi:chromate transporter [Xanthobacter autotrophicus]|uniref:chromate transporter n=1 Tax=Xanthobacter TaxID=279 RepID=UPI0024ABBF57|nr:chromate transporter [Xanthobacter autotrophicus]MDI4664549.1 chromate transporter [Xanthobacter autotrophicus]
MSANEPSVSPAATPPVPAGSRPVPLVEIFLTFLVIGATSFGGGVVAYLRNALVVSKGWLDEEQFMTALEISQALPGLNATNMSVIVGDRLRGPVGAMAGFLGMTLPGGLLVFALGVFYTSNHGNPAMHSVLAGIGASSVGLLAAVTLQIGHKQLEHLTEVALVVLTVVMVSFLHISLVIVLITVLPLALFIYRPRHDERPKVSEEEAS